MPHLTVEYSANLESRADLDELCGALLDAVMKTGLF
jgi:5-carboxymethyl-2-hydroxymuconate isomerase